MIVHIRTIDNTLDLHSALKLFPARGKNQNSALVSAESYIQSSATVHKNLDAAVVPNSCFI